MNMMDIRRRMLLSSQGFPDNYVFKEGYGFRKDLDYEILGENGAGGDVDKKRIYLKGGTSYAGTIVIANLVKWDWWSRDSETGEYRYILDSDSIDISKYSTLYIDMASNTGSWSTSMGIFKESMIGQGSPAELQKEILHDLGSSHYDAYASDSFVGGSRKTYSLDISSLDKGTIAIYSAKQSLANNTIYNIWFE